MLVPENPLLKNTLKKTIERLSTYYFFFNWYETSRFVKKYQNFQMIALVFIFDFCLPNNCNTNFRLPISYKMCQMFF